MIQNSKLKELRDLRVVIRNRVKAEPSSHRLDVWAAVCFCSSSASCGDGTKTPLGEGVEREQHQEERAPFIHTAF